MRPPNSSSARGTIALRLSASARSAASASTRVPYRRQRSRVADRLPARWSCASTVRATTRTSAPSAAKRSASAAPIPRLAPVMTTLRPPKREPISRFAILDRRIPVEAAARHPAGHVRSLLEPLDHLRRELAVLRHQLEDLAGVDVVEEVALPFPLVAARVAEPGAAGAADLVGLAVFARHRRDLAPDADHLALPLVDQRAHVGVRPLLEPLHLGAEHPVVDLLAAACHELPLRAVVPRVDRVLGVVLRERAPVAGAARLVVRGHEAAHHLLELGAGEGGHAFSPPCGARASGST